MKKNRPSIKVTKKIDPSTQEYTETLIALKKQVLETQIKATLAANTELIKLYWNIGKTIAGKQKLSAWGSNVIERLAIDLQAAFPGLGGFSRTNVFRMKSFFESYQKIPQAVGQLEDLPFFKIPWGHNAVLIEKIKDLNTRIWYAQKSIEHGWSRTILEMQIESKLHARSGKAITNFTRTLPTPHSDMAQQALKDPYLFDFLTLRDDHVELDIEQGLINNVQKLLLELGKGFSFIGRQYHLQIGNQDFYIDLLFYHFKLRCFVVVELKSRKFDPRDAGQLNFYLSAIDNTLKGPEDKPTIGLLLCKSKDTLVAEYALQDINKPIGIADYKASLLAKLPKNLKSSLPTIEEIEAELEKHETLGELKKEKETKPKRTRKKSS